MRVSLLRILRLIGAAAVLFPRWRFRQVPRVSGALRAAQSIPQLPSNPWVGWPPADRRGNRLATFEGIQVGYVIHCELSDINNLSIRLSLNLGPDFASLSLRFANDPWLVAHSYVAQAKIKTVFHSNACHYTLNCPEVRRAVIMDLL